MRARRAGTPPRASGRFGSARMPGAAVARRGWAQLYRALPRAQPGPERSGGTRPTTQFALRAARPDETTRAASRNPNWKSSKRMPELTLAEVARIAEGELEGGGALL